MHWSPSLLRIGLGFSLIAASIGGCRSGTPQPAAAPSREGEAEIIALEGVRIIDGSGRPAIEDGTILISGNNLQAVGASRDILVPAGATRPNVRGKTVLPGLISDHSHLGNVDGTTADPRNYTRSNFERQLAQFEAYGVTTVMSLGLNGPLFYEMQRDERVSEANVMVLHAAGVHIGFGTDSGACASRVLPSIASCSC
jgi:predicted amidohydrolase YtcJ